jgi:hypothetical protein
MAKKFSRQGCRGGARNDGARRPFKRGALLALRVEMSLSPLLIVFAATSQTRYFRLGSTLFARRYENTIRGR